LSVTVRWIVAARLILTRLKLDDLLDAELMRLRQQEMKYQRTVTLSGSVSSSPVIAGSHAAVSQPTSAAASQSTSTSSSQPFELPDVDISDLLNSTIHSLNNLRSSVAGCQRTSLLSASSQQRLLSTDRVSKKKAGSRKKGGENCRQNNVRQSDHSLTANGKKPSVTKTLTTGDSRKRQSSLAVDSDDEFEDSWFSSAAKKQVQDRRKDDQKPGCGSAAAATAGARKVVDKTDDESCNNQDESGIVTDITSHSTDVSCTLQSHSPTALNGRSLQRTVAAQRLSKFAFDDRLFRQRQQSPTSSRVTSVTSQSPAVTEQTLQHGTGGCYFLALYVCVY